MADVFSDQYWQNEFYVAKEDLDRIAKRMHDSQGAYGLAELAVSLITGRLKHGHVWTPAAETQETERSTVRLWDLAGEWQQGDIVISVRNLNINVPGAPPKLEVYEGEVVSINPEKRLVRLRINQQDKEIDYLLRSENDPVTQRVRNFLQEAVAEKYHAQDIRERAEGILLSHERVTSQLREALEVDDRFRVLENRWFLQELLAQVPIELLKTLHKKMMVDQRAFSLSELLSIMPELPQNDSGLFSLHLALLNDQQEIFKNEGTESRPAWRAVMPPPPPWNWQLPGFTAMIQLRTGFLHARASE